MRVSINSRKLGKRVTFRCPAQRYIYVDLNGQPGTLGDQICYGGSLHGSTMTYLGDSKKVFTEICRRWFKSYLTKESKS